MINAIFGIILFLWLVCGLGAMVYAVSRMPDDTETQNVLGMIIGLAMPLFGPIGLKGDD